MERRKIEIQTNFNRLKEECGSLVNMLNSLLDQHMKSMRIVENMRPEEILKNPNFFINVSRNQYEAAEKILTINLDLESFLITEPAVNIRSIESAFSLTKDFSEVSTDEASLDKAYITKNNNSCINHNTSQEAGFSTTHITVVDGKSASFAHGNNQNAAFSSTIVEAGDNSCSKGSSWFDPNIAIDKLCLNPSTSPKVEFGQNDDTSCINQRAAFGSPQTVQNATLDDGENSRLVIDTSAQNRSIDQNISDHMLDITVKECLNHIRVGQNTTPEKPHITQYSLTENVQNTAPGEMQRDNINRSLRTPTNSTLDRKSAESNDDTDDDRSSSESSETVGEKLNKRMSTSRQQRYLKNIKRPLMPDLSFKLVRNNSSTEFCSATDGELDAPTESDVAYQESYNHSVIKDAAALEVSDKCIVSYVIGPSEFYVTKMVVNHDQYEDLVTRLERLGNYFSKFSSKEEAKININRYCMAFSTVWESWNRAEILDWKLNAMPNTTGVQVQYVDYGDYEIVPYHNLRILPHELCDKPRLAVKCHLAYLFPPGSTPTEILQQWPESSIAAAKELLDIPNILYNVIYLEKSGDSYGVDLARCRVNSDEGKPIGQHLIDANEAVEIFQQVPQVCNPFMKEQLRTAVGGHGDMKFDEVMHRLGDSLVTESDRLEEAINGYAAQDEARICRFTKNGTCYKGPNCKMDHEGVNKDGVTTDKLRIHTHALNALPDPRIGQDLKVVITSVYSVHTFYGQIRNYDTRGESLRNLSNLLNNANHQPLKILPANGEIVIAKHWDSKWYRAQVLDIISNNDFRDVVVKVFFVDYGDVMDVQFKDLRRITEKYLHLPFQAVRFHINNIVPKRGCDIDEAIEYFEQSYLYKKFTVNVIYIASGFIDVLVSNHDDMDIGTLLIDADYAESKIISMIPFENGKFLVD